MIQIIIKEYADKIIEKRGKSMKNKETLVLNKQNLIVPIRLQDRLPRILVDQDDVLALFVHGVVQKFNARYGTNFTIEDCNQWNLENVFGPKVWDLVKEEGFFWNLEPVPGALEVFKRLYTSGRYDMYIVTASEPHAYVEKIQWLEYYMPFFSIDKHFISCKSKDAVWGDVLLDDGMHNIEAFHGIGESIVFDRPHNRHLIGFKRIYNWYEFEQYIENKFYSFQIKNEKEIAK